MSLDLELPGLDPRPRSVNVGWVRDAGPEAALHLTGPGLDAAVRIPSGAAGCVTAKLGLVILPSEPARVRLQASRPGLLDYIEVLP